MKEKRKEMKKVIFGIADSILPLRIETTKSNLLKK